MAGRPHAPRGKWAYDCPDCNASYPAPSKLRVHREREHPELEADPPPAPRRALRLATPPEHHAAELAAAEELFKRIGAATRALFPVGVPEERIIEVAEWQRFTLDFLTRWEK